MFSNFMATVALAAAIYSLIQVYKLRTDKNSLENLTHRINGLQREQQITEVEVKAFQNALCKDADRGGSGGMASKQDDVCGYGLDPVQRARIEMLRSINTANASTGKCSSTAPDETAQKESKEQQILSNLMQWKIKSPDDLHRATKLAVMGGCPDARFYNSFLIDWGFLAKLTECKPAPTDTAQATDIDITAELLKAGVPMFIAIRVGKAYADSQNKQSAFEQHEGMWRLKKDIHDNTFQQKTATEEEMKGKSIAEFYGIDVSELLESDHAGTLTFKTGLVISGEPLKSENKTDKAITKALREFLKASVDAGIVFTASNGYTVKSVKVSKMQTT